MDPEPTSTPIGFRLVRVCYFHRRRGRLSVTNACRLPAHHVDGRRSAVNRTNVTFAMRHPRVGSGRSRERCSTQESTSDLRRDAFRKPAQQLILASKRFWPKWRRSGRSSSRRRGTEKVSNTFEAWLIPATRTCKRHNHLTHGRVDIVT